MFCKAFIRFFNSTAKTNLLSAFAIAHAEPIDAIIIIWARSI